ncbi:hypothetical protein SD77_3834 [Bacillus badius]|uniref:Mobile element protein n=1 Tax=Bacillus badius TaxID=1455 RepID=A0ABR5AWC2_BACBA|nr:hypothetical protein SD78_1634 [Bacillus badius]KIL79033.1 hypothetical protein SD77_3834 [Bacillus badius]
MKPASKRKESWANKTLFAQLFLYLKERKELLRIKIGRKINHVL